MIKKGTSNGTSSQPHDHSCEGRSRGDKNEPMRSARFPQHVFEAGTEPDPRFTLGDDGPRLGLRAVPQRPGAPFCRIPSRRQPEGRC